jgi:hypothetical protein
LITASSSFGDPHIRPVAQQQPVAEFAADQIADGLAHNGGDRRDDHHPEDVELMLGAGKNPGQDEHRLARERQSDAFKPDDDSDHQEAVVGNEVGDVVPQHA